MIDPQLVAQLSTQIEALGRSTKQQIGNLTIIVNELKNRNELMSRMLSMHHFAILAIADAIESEELHQRIVEIAKRFKVKLKPTDPEYMKDEKQA